MTKLEENISGFSIFAFVFEIWPILFPHTLLRGVLATPNQHLLTLPGSPVGKSSGLHAEVQLFKSHSGHKFFFLHTNTHFFCTRTRTHVLYVYMCMWVGVHVCGTLYLHTFINISGAAACTPISDNFFYLVC